MEYKGIISAVGLKTGEIYTSRKGKVNRYIFNKESCISNYDKLRVGTRVFFDLNERETAINILSEGHIHEKYKLPLPNGTRIKCTHILQYGIKNDLNEVIKRMGKTREELEEMGYPKEVFDYVYIRTTYTIYKIYREGTPIIGDGQVNDLNEYLDSLDLKLVGSKLKRTDYEVKIYKPEVPYVIKSGRKPIGLPVE